MQKLKVTSLLNYKCMNLYVACKWGFSMGYSLISRLDWGKIFLMITRYWQNLFPLDCFPFSFGISFPWLSARGHIQFLVIKAFKMNIAHNNLFYQSREGRGSYNMVETTSLWSITLKCHSTICEIFHPLGPSCSSHPHYRIENYKRM